MKTTVEPLEGNKVKLSVELDDVELEQAIDSALRRIARDVRIPGFRPGKAPNRLVEARVGSDFARREALNEALPDFYARAVQENELEPISAPEIDITAGRDEGAVAFDAVVEVMPPISVAGYESLKVVLPSFAVADEEIDAQVDRLRQQFGELQSVDRRIKVGDYVSIDRKVYRHDEVVVAADDELYEVGRATVGPELDENLLGSRVGDILKFNAHHEDVGEVTFQVLVKDVREMTLPEVTDEWAAEASEFDTVAELRENVANQIGAVRKLEAALTVRDKVIDALVELVDADIPDALVGAEMDRRVQMLLHRLSHQGADLAAYLAASGRSEEEFVAGLRAEALAAVKADLALRAVADKESVEVTDEDLEAEVLSLAERAKRKPAALRRELESQGRWPAVRSGIAKTKTLEWLIGRTQFVDEEGNLIDRSEFAPPEPEETDG